MTFQVMCSITTSLRIFYDFEADCHEPMQMHFGLKTNDLLFTAHYVFSTYYLHSQSLGACQIRAARDSRGLGGSKIGIYSKGSGMWHLTEIRYVKASQSDAV
jgi:hypothetical protein